MVSRLANVVCRKTLSRDDFLMFWPSGPRGEFFNRMGGFRTFSADARRQCREGKSGRSLRPKIEHVAALPQGSISPNRAV